MLLDCWGGLHPQGGWALGLDGLLGPPPPRRRLPGLGQPSQRRAELGLTSCFISSCEYCNDALIGD